MDSKKVVNSLELYCVPAHRRGILMRGSRYVHGMQQFGYHSTRMGHYAGRSMNFNDPHEELRRQRHREAQRRYLAKRKSEWQERNKTATRSEGLNVSLCNKGFQDTSSSKPNFLSHVDPSNHAHSDITAVDNNLNTGESTIDDAANCLQQLKALCGESCESNDSASVKRSDDSATHL